MEVKEEKKNDITNKSKELTLREKLKGKRHLLPIVLVIVGILVIIIAFGSSNRGHMTISSTSTLEKILEISELSTVEYTYNAIVTKYQDEEKKKVEYHVSYEGIIEAGIDFDEISVEVDEKNKIVLIELPDATVHSSRVNMDTLDFIHSVKPKEAESITQEAYKLCLDDLRQNGTNEEMILQNAKENARSAIEGLLKPWINTVDDVYTVKIV